MCSTICGRTTGHSSYDLVEHQPKFRQSVEETHATLRKLGIAKFPNHQMSQRGSGFGILLVEETTEIEVVETWEIVDDSGERATCDHAAVEGQSREGVSKS